MKIINKSDLNILEESKKGTLILDNDDYKVFGFESRPFNLSAKPSIDGHTNELIYHVKAICKHSFSVSKKNITHSDYFKIIDIRLIKKELEITDLEISEMFGYANTNSYATSSAKKRYEAGLVAFYKLIKSK